MNSSNPFILFVDRLGHKPELFINHHKRDVSWIGAFTTILVGVLILAIFFFYLVEFLMGTGMTIVSLKENVNLPISFDLHDKLFMFRFINSKGKTVDPKIAYLSFVHWSYHQSKFSYTHLETEPCEYNRHLPKEIYHNHISSININDYLCLSPESNMTLSYDHTLTKGSYLLLFIVKCTGQTHEGEKCLPLNEIDQILEDDLYYLTYEIENTKIDHYNFPEPLNSISFNNNILVPTAVSYDYSMFYKHVNYHSDSGWLLTAWETLLGFQYDETLTEKILHTTNQLYIEDNTFSSYKFRLSPSIVNKYERSFTKIPTVIANISALSKMVLVLGELIARLFTTAYYYVDIISLAQRPVASKKQSLNNITHFKSIKSKSIIEVDEKTKVNPGISCLWSIYPRMTKNTTKVEVCKIKVAEMLSVENLIKKLFSFETISQSIIEKNGKIDQSNCIPLPTCTNGKLIPHMINITDTKPCLIPNLRLDIHGLGAGGE